jgi:hypothetical protein
VKFGNFLSPDSRDPERDGAVIDLMAAIETPDDQPDAGRSGVVERHRRAVVPAHVRFLTIIVKITATA